MDFCVYLFISALKNRGVISYSIDFCPEVYTYNALDLLHSNNIFKVTK